MLLTIRYTGNSADDLGYLLHKNPTRVQTFSLTFGTAYVFYPQVKADTCTAAMLLDIDTTCLLRKQNKQQSMAWTLQHYVNDRAYVASSFMSVAIAQVFGTALNGKSKERPELVQQALPFEVTLSVVSCHGGIPMLERLFVPLGYEVEASGIPLDEQFPEWGDSPYYRLRLRQTVRLQDLLAHLYVLLPVLDNDKHYYIQQDEQDKLLRYGGQWLKEHPAREMIVRRYLKYRRSLTEPLLAKWQEQEQAESQTAADLSTAERPPSLNQLRLEAVATELERLGSKRVLDLGCGEGKLIKVLLEKGFMEKIVGVDPHFASLQIAKERVQKLAHQIQVDLLTGSVFHRDRQLRHFDSAVLMEVIEHLDPEHLPRMEETCFGYLQPDHLIVTTPNREYNVVYTSLAEDKLRHNDHRFEWTRDEFATWAKRVAAQYGYRLQLKGIGEEVDSLGQPTQMAIFTLKEARHQHGDTHS